MSRSGSCLAFSSGIAQSATVQANSGPLRVLLAVIFTTALVACRTLEKKGSVPESVEAGNAVETADSAPAATTVLPIGVVQHVDESARFVLIRSSRTFQIEPETLLTIRGSQGEPIATVKVSPARKGSFLTADFVEGTPKIGQSATMESTPRKQSPSAPGAPVPAAAEGIQVLE